MPHNNWQNLPLPASPTRLMPLPPLASIGFHSAPKKQQILSLILSFPMYQCDCPLLAFMTCLEHRVPRVTFPGHPVPCHPVVSVTSEVFSVRCEGDTEVKDSQEEERTGLLPTQENYRIYLYRHLRTTDGQGLCPEQGKKKAFSFPQQGSVPYFQKVKEGCIYRERHERVSGGAREKQRCRGEAWKRGATVFEQT